MLESGGVFAGYTVERRLGRGGMGSVYLARHPRLPRWTALKLLNRELFDDTEIRARFEREADLVAQLDHPNIVTVFDRGIEGDQLWIAMQYIDGVDAASLDAWTLPPQRAVQIVAETAKALDFAHRKGVLHRDVKPANILLERSAAGAGERVFLTDFGIARLRDDTGKLTQTGTFTATLAFASPEQLSGAVLDHRSDQYSLACSLFRLLTGTVPFDATNPVAVIQGHMQQPPPRISAVRPGLPVALDAVLMRALAKRPQDRFDSCAEFAAAAWRALAEPSGSSIPLAGNGFAPAAPTNPVVFPQDGAGHAPFGGYPASPQQFHGAVPPPFPGVGSHAPGPQPFQYPGDPISPGSPNAPIGRDAEPELSRAREYLGAPRRSRFQATPGGWIGLLLLLGFIALIIAMAVSFARGDKGSASSSPDTTTTEVSTRAVAPSAPASTKSKPKDDKSALGANAALISKEFPAMVPQTDASNVVHSGSGYHDKTCFAHDAGSSSAMDAGSPDFGNFTAFWYCFGGQDKANYEIYGYGSAADAEAVLAALPAHTRSTANHGGRAYTNYLLDDNPATLRPRMITQFTGDRTRGAFLMYSVGFIATRAEFTDWWNTAPLN
ncbi:serine/threonine-protein kinase [Nocardia sp. NPDC050710]|uniref:serine/threonine-protein kinase n=1 Tax=Nocardia sp. NPDC050710 TaxID=3157220 RepID=UPI0033C0C931